MFEPVIKWSGSKRSQAEEIIKYSPDGIVLCDGPADPDDEPKLIENIKELIK